jgi:cAMP-dependent protein kinase regulator
MSKQKVKVPDSLRDVLLEFSIAYLLEQPGDVIDFAVDYFSKLQTNRAQTGGFVFKKPSTPDDSIVSQDEGEFLWGWLRLVEREIRRLKEY